MSNDGPVLWRKYPYRHYPDARGSFNPAAIPTSIPIPTHQATPADVERVGRLGLDPRRPDWEQLRGLLLRQGIRADDLATLTVGAILATLNPVPPAASDTLSSPPAPAEKAHRRGRPADTDPEADRRLYEHWQSGCFITLHDLAERFGKKKRDVERALDRHRKRLERGKK
jgi:hypothetical protein